MACKLSKRVDLIGEDGFFRGDDWIIPLNFTEDGIDVDLTGSTILITVSVETTITATAVISGNQAIITIPRADTESLVVGTYNYDIERTNAVDERLTIMYGQLEVLADETI